MILLLAVLLSSCGEEKKKDPIRLADYDQPYSAETTTETSTASNTSFNSKNEEGTSEKTEKTADETKAAQAKVVEVPLEGNDQMKFNKKEIQVPAGSTVKLTLTHTGSMPKTAMGHNFVLLKKGTDVAEFAMKAMNFPDNNYIPKDTDKVIAHTKIIGGGESTTIEFKAPAPGTYTFICSFPRHYTMMKGEFIVE